MTRLTLLTLAAALAATSAHAIHRESDRYVRKQVNPGELISRTLGCDKGELAGGGYLISGQPDNRIDFNVIANFPLSDGRWRVDLRNITDENQPLTLQIYALCTE